MRGSSGGAPASDWEKIAEGPQTKRLAVPGGWLYWTREYLSEPNTVFVPDPELRPS